MNRLWLMDDIIEEMKEKYGDERIWILETRGWDLTNTPKRRNRDKDRNDWANIAGIIFMKTAQSIDHSINCADKAVKCVFGKARDEIIRKDPKRFSYNFSYIKFAINTDRCIESCIWFYNDCAEVRAYYSALGAEICRESEYRGELLYVLNYINAAVFLSCGNGGGIYEPHMLYTPRIYMTEDGCFDITITTIINYDFWEVAPVETEDYITIYCPELLDRLTYAIFGVLLGQISSDDAKSKIRQDILGEQ